MAYRETGATSESLIQSLHNLQQNVQDLNRNLTSVINAQASAQGGNPNASYTVRGSDDRDYITMSSLSSLP